jgi:hypothetical protein
MAEGEACAPAAKGHAPAAPSALRKSRRRMLLIEPPLVSNPNRVSVRAEHDRRCFRDLRNRSRFRRGGRINHIDIQADKLSRDFG